MTEILKIMIARPGGASAALPDEARTSGKEAAFLEAADAAGESAAEPGHLAQDPLEDWLAAQSGVTAQLAKAVDDEGPAWAVQEQARAGDIAELRPDDPDLPADGDPGPDRGGALLVLDDGAHSPLGVASDPLAEGADAAPSDAIGQGNVDLLEERPRPVLAGGEAVTAAPDRVGERLMSPDAAADPQADHAARLSGSAGVAAAVPAAAAGVADGRGTEGREAGEAPRAGPAEAATGPGDSGRPDETVSTPPRGDQVRPSGPAVAVVERDVASPPVATGLAGSAGSVSEDGATRPPAARRGETASKGAPASSSEAGMAAETTAKGEGTPAAQPRIHLAAVTERAPVQAPAAVALEQALAATRGKDVELDASIFPFSSTNAELRMAATAELRTASAPQLAPPPSRQMADALVIHRGETTEILLSPEELGRVRMVMAGPDRMQLVIWAERAETLDLLRRSADTLSADLAESGFGSSSMEFRDDGDWQVPKPTASAPHDEVLSVMVQPLVLAQRHVDPQRRIDIRV